MKQFFNRNRSILTIILLIGLFFSLIHPVVANVGEVETENNGFRKTEVYDATNGGPKETGNSFFDSIFEFFKNIKESIIDGVDNFGSWMKEGWEEFKDWLGPKWDGFTDWLSDFWDGVKEFFSQEWVQNVLKVIGAIIVVAAIILGGVYLLAAIGITLAVGTIIGAIAFGAIGVILAFASGESSFWGMVAGGLAGGLSFLGGLGVLRLLGALKLIPASGFLRILALGGLGGSGAVTFTLLHGALHYLFTGDSSLWKQAFTFESLFFNFTLGAVMGPLAARIFGKMGVSRLVSGQGNKFVIFLSRKLGRPVSQIANRLNRAWVAFKSVSIYGAFNAGLTAVLDSIIQWKETGKVDWKRTSQKAAVVFVTTLVIGLGTLTIPKLYSTGCACGDEIASSVSKKGQDSTGKIEDGNSDTTVNKSILYGEYTYNMVENPGPLADINPSAASTFRSGMYNVIKLEDDIILYRSGKSGGGKNALGQYFTREPGTRIEGRIDSAVKPQWIDPKTGVLTGSSPLDSVYKIKIPKGTVIYEGPAGYQEGIYLGGGNQIFIPEPWKIKGVEMISESPIN